MVAHSPKRSDLEGLAVRPRLSVSVAARRLDSCPLSFSSPSCPTMALTHGALSEEEVHVDEGFGHFRQLTDFSGLGHKAER